LLDSIEHKDRKWLQELTEPQLIEPLLSINHVKQVERKSPIELMFYNLSVGIGVTFQRGETQYQTMVDKNNVILYSEKDQNPAHVMKYMTTGMPVLLSYSIGVRSSRKLILN
jgi:hypothetical protein